MELQIGMPVVLHDVHGLKDCQLWPGQEGMVNSMVNVEGVSYIYFMPDNTTRMYVITEDRVTINEDKIGAWEAENE